MPALTVLEGVLRHLATSDCASIASLSTSNHRNPYPVAAAVRQVASDRLSMAGGHLRAGDHLFQHGIFRASISRHYYAMYHTARAVVFAEIWGDDYQRHNILARHLPAGLLNRQLRETQLTEARLLRNEADYEPYPISEQQWEAEAQNLTVVASEFVAELENYALSRGLV